MYLIKAGIIAVVMIACVSCAGEKKVELKTQKDKVSYAFGADIARNFFKRQNVDANPAAVAQGIKDVLTDAEPMLDEKEIKDVIMAFRQEQMKKEQEERKAKGGAAVKKGQDFLANNAKAKGVVTLPSGLQYKVIKKGTGRKPGLTDQVKCHYRGTTIDGKEFDSSYKRKQPATFGVTGVIKGWTEALQLMKTGAHWKLFIPSTLAYGERGAGKDIGPNETLIFEIELLEIIPGK